MNAFSPQGADNPRVVVINSESEFLRVVQELLESEGYEVSTMHVEDSPYELIVSFDPAVIVIDFVYEKPEAWKLLSMLDENEHTRNIPLLATSTDEALVEKLKAVSEHRIQQFVLVKPLELEEMLAAVDRLCAKQPSDI